MTVNITANTKYRELASHLRETRYWDATIDSEEMGLDHDGCVLVTFRSAGHRGDRIEAVVQFGDDDNGVTAEVEVTIATFVAGEGYRPRTAFRTISNPTADTIATAIDEMRAAGPSEDDINDMIARIERDEERRAEL